MSAYGLVPIGDMASAPMVEDLLRISHNMTSIKRQNRNLTSGKSRKLYPNHNVWAET